ncbi:MAG: STAS domain-containing protein [Planctomycetota bacterium]
MTEKLIELDIEHIGDITIVAIRSLRVPVDMSGSFEEQVVRVIEGLEAPKVVIDFDGVEFISSAILGKLIKLSGRVVTDRQGHLTLCSLDERIAEVFKITGLEKLFSIHGTRSEAVAALR